MAVAQGCGYAKSKAASTGCVNDLSRLHSTDYSCPIVSFSFDQRKTRLWRET
jgi:hypothetical protein